MLSANAAGASVLRNDVRLTNWVQNAPVPAGESLAWFGNWGGSFPVAATVTVAVAFLLLIQHHLREAAILLFATVIRSSNGLLKELFESPRPTSRLVDVSEHARGMGFPSGHSMGVVLCYGAIAVVAGRVITRCWLRWAVQGGAFLMMALTGYGRIYTGAHWPSDVLGGFGWGLVLLFVVVSLVDALYRRRPQPHHPVTPGLPRARILAASHEWANATGRIGERLGVGEPGGRSARRVTVDAEGA